MKKHRQAGKKGFTLITFALGIFTLLGMAGLAIDIGRVYIVKNETQTYSDSAALAATLELDGTAAGITRAKAQVAQNTNRWNLQTSAFSNSQVSFAINADGPWETDPALPLGYRYARVAAAAPVPITLLSIFSNGTPALATLPVGFLLLGSTLSVNANSAGGQEPKVSFSEGLFPFSPFAHLPAGPDFGLVAGQQYTLRWGANAKLNQTCAGDNLQSIIDLAQANSGSERGYIESTSADLIRSTIVDDYQSVVRTIGDAVNMSGGAKQSQLDSLFLRINQDSDSLSPTFAAYSSAQTGNGRRIVAVPINTGYPSYKIVQIAAFLLLPTNSYKNGGGQAWCAEYVGAWVQGSSNKGAGIPGAYVARIVK